MVDAILELITVVGAAGTQAGLWSAFGYGVKKFTKGDKTVTFEFKRFFTTLVSAVGVFALIRYGHLGATEAETYFMSFAATIGLTKYIDAKFAQMNVPDDVTLPVV